MGSLSDELSLDLRPSFVPKTIINFLKEISMIGNVSEKATRLNGFVKGLEEEMRKIDAFKRELPLCMLLLKDAILVLKDEAKQCTVRNSEPVFEEFIPLKKQNRKEEEKDDDDDGDITRSNKREKEIKDKKNWMSSVQLWNADDYPSRPVNQRIFDPKQNYKGETEINMKEAYKNMSGSRVWTPFEGYSGFLARNNKEDKEEISSVQGLSLVTPGMRNLKDETGSGFGSVSSSRSTGLRVISSSAPSSLSNCRSVTHPPPHQQTARKQRRCWSPDLHRCFVNALQQLGGSQVATPKQIRELMQVEGLTNDEVKSHLQKYRLHNGKLQPANSNPSTEKQSVVVIGGNLWNSQETFGDRSKGSSSQSGSPEGPLQLAAATAGDSMEDEEDTNSESFSWKGHAQKPGKDEL